MSIFLTEDFQPFNENVMLAQLFELNYLSKKVKNTNVISRVYEE